MNSCVSQPPAASRRSSGNAGRLGKAGIFTLLFAATFTVMVGSLITPALPAIAGELGFTRAPGWLVTLPSLGVVLFSPLAGRILAGIGARAAILVGLLAYGVFGEGAVFLAFSKVAVLGDRLLLGAATALVMAAGTMLIAEFFDGAERLRMIAWQGMAIEAGGVVFLALGGVLGSRGWRMPFLLYLLAWACLLLVWFYVPRSAAIEREVKPVAGGIANLLPFWIAAFLAMAIFFVAYITLPITLASSFHLSEAQTGYFMAFISLVAVGFAGCLPRVTRVVPARAVLHLSFLFLGAGELIFAHARSVPGMLLGAVATGAGFGFSIPLANHLVLETGSPQNRGRDLSSLSMAIFLGQFVSTFATVLGASPAQEQSRVGMASLGIGIVALVFSSVYRRGVRARER
ncbi:MFS transporter [Silvibacterium sp.]|uniref:MFS transporter n=1 Tax=Silvibacterium sp. TaxID=1964179 RepID=UPI0039E43E8E